MKTRRRPVTFLAAVLVAAAVPRAARAAPGGLDPTFGTGGKAITPVGTGTDAGRSVAVQSDGKIVVAGYSRNGNDSDFAVARYLASGQPDPSFGGGQVTTDLGTDNDVGYSVAVQSDDKIVVAGYTGSGSGVDFAVVRYNTNGTVDLSFGVTGKVITDLRGDGDFGSTVALQTDGKIVVAGCSYNGFNDDFGVVRYNTNGTLDSTFGFGGIVTSDFGDTGDFGYSVAVQSDGKIVVAGESDAGGDYDFTVARYLPGGSLDSGFGTSGRVFTRMGDANSAANGVVVQSDGRIVAAGYSYNGDDTDFAVARYLANGALDSSFGGGTGKANTDIGTSTDYGNAVAVQGDGKILVAGEKWNGHDWDFALVRYRADGTLDSGFDTDGKVTTAVSSGSDRGFSVALQSDGNILVAGSAVSTTGSDVDFAVVRYDGDPAPPSVVAFSPVAITATTATLRGTVNPGGQTSTARFQYGRTITYGSSATVAISPANGSAAQSVSANLSGLTPGSLYHFRLTATNSAGTSSTSDFTFTTDPAGQNTPLEDWRLFHFGITTNTGSAADGADPDTDGIPNLVEWGCYLNPTLSGTLTTSLAMNGGNLEFTYTRSLTALNAGTVFIVEWSDTPDTGPWQSTGVTQSIVTGSGSVQEMKATLPAGSGGERFVRLRVTAP